MNILDEIIAYKKTEVEQKKKLVSLEQLKDSEAYNKRSLKLSKDIAAKNVPAVIAEYKRKSPSKGWFTKAELEDVVTNYFMQGASAISILTDNHFFGGSLEDLILARKLVQCPLLRKDFIIDTYQIYETKSVGADIILLIAAALTPTQVKEMAMEAKQIGLEVLLEIHNEEEAGYICNDVDFAGVNNRDLKTFTVDIKRSIELINYIPKDKIAISESGIDSVEAIKMLHATGYKGFLIGEKFMKAPQPQEAFSTFMKALKYNNEN